MIYYLDTSFVVTALTAEPTSVHTQAWIAGHLREGLCVSAWTAADYSAAINSKCRCGELSKEGRTIALARFDQLAARVVQRVAVQDAHVVEAARLTRLGIASIRAPDALHLAISSALNLVLVTRDARLAEAGAQAGALTSLQP